MAEPKTSLGDADNAKYIDDTQPHHAEDADNLTSLGYKQQLQRNRSTLTLLFQSLAVAAVGLQ